MEAYAVRNDADRQASELIAVMFEREKTFIRLVKVARKIADSDAEDEIKYDMIFSEDISRAVFATGLMPKYCDPEMDYRDDYLAFIEAAEAKVFQLERALSVVDDEV